MNLIEKIIAEKIHRYGVWAMLVSSIFSIGLASLTIKLLRLVPYDFRIPGSLYLILELVIFSGLLVAILEIWRYLLRPRFIEPILWRLIGFNREVNTTPDISKWIYQGSFRISNSINITKSSSGALLKNRRFKNFHLHCRILIVSRNVGIVFRAQGLDDYLMIQISGEAKGSEITITPHIRFFGNWEVLTSTKLNSFNSPNNLDIDLKVLNRDVVLYVTSVNSFPRSGEFRWQIPTHFNPNIMISNDENSQKKDEFNETLNPKLRFALHYGMIGFRAWHNEEAQISDFRISKLRRL